ncbi:hypothetical protein MKW94_012243, partial [Papaver nudicaule]|nr:hypothetical protein [Papaver nudicaule]
MASSSLSSANRTSLAILSFFFLVHQLIQLSAALTLPPNIKVPALLVFGDSIVDPGNNNNLPTIAKCNFLPYGQDFMGGKPTGRFSNGKVPGDLIAQALGIADIIPAYLDPSLPPNDLLTGVSFASGAAGYDPLTSQLAMALSLEKQVELFNEYLAKVTAVGGKEKAKSILSESLYLVIIGSNDLGNTYFGSQVRSNYDVPAYADLMVEGATRFIQQLYDVGARRIGVFGVPPIGCLPSQRTLAGGHERNCVARYNQAAQIFNSKLSSSLAKLTSTFKHGHAAFADIYNPILEIIDNPHNYGFEEATIGCCGTGRIESIFLCNELNPFTCDDVSKYVFWDSYHPTERAYQVFLGPFLERNLNNLLCGK